MLRTEKSVFISYRRDVSQYAAFVLYEKLTADGYDVFMDVKNIGNGIFGPLILKQIEARAHFLALLAPGSVNRCSHENDWFRREIEHALATQRNIIPIMFEGFSFKKADPFLTKNLKQIKAFNGMRVYIEYFEEAITRLEHQFLEQPVDILISHPAYIPHNNNQVAFELKSLASGYSELESQRRGLKEILTELQRERRSLANLIEETQNRTSLYGTLYSTCDHDLGTQYSSQHSKYSENKNANQDNCLVQNQARSYDIEREIEKTQQQLKDSNLYRLALKISSIVQLGDDNRMSSNQIECYPTDVCSTLASN